LCWGVVHRGAGAWDQAVENLEFGLTHISVDSIWEHSFASASLLASLEALGELGLLAHRSEQIARSAQDIGDWRMFCLGQSYAALTALAADDVPRTRALLADTSTRLAVEAFQITHLHALKVAIDCDLYTGDVVAAWRRISESWSAIERSSLMDNRMRRSMALGLRARAGLALCASTISGYDFVAEIVVRDTAHIECEQTADARALAALLRAGLARLAGDEAELRRCLSTAVADFDSTARALHATCARRCLAAWAHTAEERNARGAAESFMRLQGIARPDRWTAVLAPGLLAIDDRPDLLRP
jgi:hypothetical protein